MQWGRGCDRVSFFLSILFPTSFPDAFLPYDGRRQSDRHLHLRLGAGHQDDRRLLGGATDVIFLLRYHLEGNAPALFRSNLKVRRERLLSSVATFRGASRS